MVHCRTAVPYSSSAHPTEGDYSGKGVGDCGAPGSHARRWRGINRIGASIVPTCKYDNATARYSKDEGGARACVVYHVPVNVPHWEIIWRLMRRIHFRLGLRLNCVIFADNGDISYPIAQHWRNMKRPPYSILWVLQIRGAQREQLLVTSIHVGPHPWCILSSRREETRWPRRRGKKRIPRRS